MGNNEALERIKAKIKARIQKIQLDITIHTDDCEYDIGVSDSKKEELNFLESLLSQKDQSNAPNSKELK